MFNHRAKSEIICRWRLILVFYSVNSTQRDIAILVCDKLEKDYRIGRTLGMDGVE